MMQFFQDAPDSVETSSDHLLENVEPEVRDGEAESMKLSGASERCWIVRMP